MLVTSGVLVMQRCVGDGFSGIPSAAQLSPTLSNLFDYVQLRLTMPHYL